MSLPVLRGVQYLPDGGDVRSAAAAFIGGFAPPLLNAPKSTPRFKDLHIHRSKHNAKGHSQYQPDHFLPTRRD